MELLYSAATPTNRFWDTGKKHRKHFRKYNKTNLFWSLPRQSAILNQHGSGFISVITTIFHERIGEILILLLQNNNNNNLLWISLECYIFALFLYTRHSKSLWMVFIEFITETDTSAFKLYPSVNPSDTMVFKNPSLPKSHSLTSVLSSAFKIVRNHYTNFQSGLEILDIVHWTFFCIRLSY